jgi:triacylglycerol lipase
MVPEPGEADLIGGAEPAGGRTTLDGRAARWWGRPHAELLWQAEAMRLFVDPVFYGYGVPRGDGRPVLLLPGFVTGDYTLGPMAMWLRRIGYLPAACGIWVNADCSERALGRIERRVDALHHRHERRVALVGHSRGGYLAKALAALRPELVSHVVSLGGGLSGHLDVSVPGRAAMALARLVHERTTDRVLRRGCMTERCTCAFADAYARPFPPAVRLTSIHSKGDGMVRWQSCVVPYAENVEVGGSHIGLAYNHKAYRAIARALAEPEHDAPV